MRKRLRAKGRVEPSLLYYVYVDLKCNRCPRTKTFTIYDVPTRGSALQEYLDKSFAGHCDARENQQLCMGIFSFGTRENQQIIRDAIKDMSSVIGHRPQPQQPQPTATATDSNMQHGYVSAMRQAPCRTCKMCMLMRMASRGRCSRQPGSLLLSGFMDL